MSNKSLIDAVFAETRFDREWIDACIEAHQSRYPASWQDWEEGDRARAMTAMLREAHAAGERAPARVVLFHG